MHGPNNGHAAQLGERVVTAQFIDTRGFAAAHDHEMEIRISTGTELAFDKFIECEPKGVRTSPKKIRRKRVRFWRFAKRNVDALRFKDGFAILLNDVCLGQYATVAKLPGMCQPGWDA